MKIKPAQVIYATLDLVMEMSAKQRAFHAILLRSLAENDHEYAKATADLLRQSNKELEVIRAKVFQYSTVDPNDLLNGLFDL